MSYPNQPPGYGPPPNVIVNQKSGCGTAAIVILILLVIGTVIAIVVGFGLLGVLFA